MSNNLQQNTLVRISTNVLRPVLLNSVVTIVPSILKIEYSDDRLVTHQRCWKHLDSGEAALLSEAGRRCGCQTQGLCMPSQIT